MFVRPRAKRWARRVVIRLAQDVVVVGAHEARHMSSHNFGSRGPWGASSSCGWVLVVCLAVTGLYGQSPPSKFGTDSSGALTGALVSRENAQPVAYGTVTLVGTGVERFADTGGHFHLTRVVPGTYTIRARQLGYAPTDTTVQVGPAPAVTNVTIPMARLPLLRGLVKVEGHHSKDCVATGAPDSTAEPDLAVIFTQMRENVDRFRLLWDQYHLRYTRSQWMVLHQDPGRDSMVHRSTVTLKSGGHPPYRVGAVVSDELGPEGRPRRVMSLPVLGDLTNSTFVAAHCFVLGGEQRLDGARVFRVDFRPASAIASADVEGSVFLDADRWIVRSAVVRLTKPESLEPPLVDLTATSTYRELIPLVPVFEATRTVQPLQTLPGYSVGSHPPPTRTRTIISEDRSSDYAFETPAPGDS